MSHSITDRFVAALLEAEETNDPTPLVELYAEESECQNLAHDEPAKGVAGAKAFWTDYLKAFESIKSDFHNIISGDTHAVLEWISQGTLPSGKPIRYRGVSVLEYADDKVTRFHSYYDSAAFVTAPATAEPAKPA